MILSIILFFATLTLILLIIWWLPADYFIKEESTSFIKTNHPLLYKILQILKNIIGAILIILGVIMLILPGQGVLTILIGLILVDFPGKKHLLQKLVTKESVQKSLNYLRKKMKREPFIFPKSL